MFNPKGTTTRGEAAAFLVKMLDASQNRKNDKGAIQNENLEQLLFI